MFLFLPRWIRHRAARPIENNGNRYIPGQKRCQMQVQMSDVALANWLVWQHNDPVCNSVIPIRNNDEKMIIL
jgi:hypothetical protein